MKDWIKSTEKQVSEYCMITEILIMCIPIPFLVIGILLARFSESLSNRESIGTVMFLISVFCTLISVAIMSRYGYGLPSNPDDQQCLQYLKECDERGIDVICHTFKAHDVEVSYEGKILFPRARRRSVIEYLNEKKTQNDFIESIELEQYKKDLLNDEITITGKTV